MKRNVRVIFTGTAGSAAIYRDVLDREPASQNYAFIDVETISGIADGRPGQGVDLICGETIYRDFSFYTGDNKQSSADAYAELEILRRPEYLIARPPS